MQRECRRSYNKYVSDIIHDSYVNSKRKCYRKIIVVYQLYKKMEFGMMTTKPKLTFKPVLFLYNHQMMSISNHPRIWGPAPIQIAPIQMYLILRSVVKEIQGITCLLIDNPSKFHDPDEVPAINLDY